LGKKKKTADKTTETRIIRQNFNFVDRKRGFHKCLDIIESIKPDYIINQHQPEAFIYTEKEILFLRENLEKRYDLLCDLTPWQSPDYSLDPYWVRLYPYISRVKCGEPCVKELQFTNHTDVPAQVRIRFTASKGLAVPKNIEVALPSLTSGLKNQNPADICVPVTFLTDETGTENKETKKIHAVGAEVWLNGIYFGEICKSVIFTED